MLMHYQNHIIIHCIKETSYNKVPEPTAVTLKLNFLAAFADKKAVYCVSSFSASNSEHVPFNDVNVCCKNKHRPVEKDSLKQKTAGDEIYGHT